MIADKIQSLTIREHICWNMANDRGRLIQKNGDRSPRLSSKCFDDQRLDQGRSLTRLRVDQCEGGRGKSDLDALGLVVRARATSGAGGHSSFVRSKLGLHFSKLRVGHHFGVVRPISVDHLPKDISLGCIKVVLKRINRGLCPTLVGNLLADPQVKPVAVLGGADVKLAAIVGQHFSGSIGCGQASGDCFARIFINYGVGGHGLVSGSERPCAVSMHYQYTPIIRRSTTNFATHENNWRDAA